jgi:hypothetical protein
MIELTAKVITAESRIGSHRVVTETITTSFFLECGRSLGVLKTIFTGFFNSIVTSKVLINPPL